MSWVTFAGIPGVRCHFKRARGYQSSTSFVDVVAKNLALRAPGIAGIVQPQTQSPNAAAMDAALVAPDPKKAVLQSLVEWEGALEIGQKIRGKTRRLKIDNLFVTKIESVLCDGDMNDWIYRLFLSDVRHFWTRGVLPQWTFNRLTATDTLAPDSCKAQGKPFSLGEIVSGSVVPSLFRAPKLSAYPKSWDTDFASHQFDPWPLAMSALAKIVTERGSEDPCLRLDGSVAIHEGGDGLVGTCDVNSVGSPTGPNKDPIDATRLPWEDGRAQSVLIQPGYPDDYVMVRGGQTIATFEVDDWEPVLIVKGKPWPLDEKTVRNLTGGRYGIDWLRNFVLADGGHKDAWQLDKDTVKLLRSQAWRMFRLPSVTTNRDAKLGQAGPLAHLLPLLPRADVIGGKRRPITVECYSVAKVTKYLQETKDTSKYRQAVVALKEIEDAIASIQRTNNSGSGGLIVDYSTETRPLVAGVARAVSFGKTELGDIPKAKRDAYIAVEDEILEVTTGQPSEAGVPYGVTPKGLVDATRPHPEREVDRPRIMEMIRLARYAKAINEKIDPGLGELWRKHMRDLLSAGDEANGTARAALFAAGEKIVEVEDKGGPYKAVRAVVHAALREAQQAARTAAERQKQKDAAGETDFLPRYYHLNESRGHDAHAVVVDAKAGIIRTSMLAGHVTNAGHEHLTACGPFIPCPVKVTFGAVLRPRIDVPQDPKASKEISLGSTPSVEDPSRDERDRAGKYLEALLDGVTPEAAAKAIDKPDAKGPPKNLFPNHPKPCKGGDNHIPSVKSDKGTWFAPVFRRTGEGQSVIAASEADAPLHQINVIAKPDLVELIGLDGSSNGASLRETAKEVADAHFKVKDLLVSRTYTIAGPEPVNCDGIVEETEIVSQEQDGTLCGFFTIVRTGSKAFPSRPGTQSKRPPIGGGVDAAVRGGLK